MAFGTGNEARWVDIRNLFDIIHAERARFGLDETEIGTTSYITTNYGAEGSSIKASLVNDIGQLTNELVTTAGVSLSSIPDNPTVGSLIFSTALEAWFDAAKAAEAITGITGNASGFECNFESNWFGFSGCFDKDTFNFARNSFSEFFGFYFNGSFTFNQAGVRDFGFCSSFNGSSFNSSGFCSSFNGATFYNSL